MSVQAGPIYKRYAANGIATVYAIPFLVIDAADLQVTLDGVPVTSGFTLTGLGNPACTATFTAAPLGDLLFLLSIPIQRLTDYQTNGDLLAKTINLDFDRLWLAIKQLIGISNQSLATGDLEPEGVNPLPVVGSRALKVLAFDASGNPVTSNLTLAQLEQQPSGAAASAAAAAASAVLSGQRADDSAASALASANSATAASTSAGNALASENNAAATLQAAKRQAVVITPSVSAGALTLTVPQIPLQFQSQTSGALIPSVPTAPIAITLPSGSTLGAVAGTSTRFYLLATYLNATTWRLAVVNASTFVVEESVQIPVITALSAGATSASLIYATTADTNRIWKILGFFEVTQAVSGTWVAPTKIVSAGGEALAALRTIGIDQTWQDVTASRVKATTYTNTTGKPIYVSISVNSGTSPTLTVNGIVVWTSGASSIGYVLQAIIPVGGTYVFTGGATINSWTELRA